MVKRVLVRRHQERHPDTPVGRLLGRLYENIAIISLTFLMLFIGFYIHDQQVRATHARNEGRATICAIVERDDNGLLRTVTPPQTPEKQAELQQKLELWERFVAEAPGTFHCDLNLQAPK